jgi:hypothetical protein
LTPKQRILFISRETYRSPLTINVSGLSTSPEIIKIGMPVEINPGRIEIPEAWFSIWLSKSSPWFPPDPDENILKPGRHGQILEELAWEISNNNNNDGFGFLLSPLMNHSETTLLMEPSQAAILQKVKRLERTLDSQDPGEIVNAFKALLGLGRGLTPSGDDLIMGFLVTINRWPAACQPVQALGSINQLAVQTAYLSTTAISANLIECATSGHTDERLLSTLDGIVTRSLTPHACVENLMAYGASSGIDALAGMMVALQK